jgi:hypothetical protein
MARYKKGQTGNPNGRPKGKPNRSTRYIKDAIAAFIGDNIDQIQKNFNLLEPRDKLAFIRDLLKYAIPTQSATEINVNALSDAELDRLTDELISKLNDGDNDENE